jgi:hypothetical protein
MKLIKSDMREVTLQFSRREFNLLSQAICMSISICVRAKALQFTDLETKIGAALLPKFQSLFERFTRIEMQTGWLAEDDDEF